MSRRPRSVALIAFLAVSVVGVLVTPAMAATPVEQNLITNGTFDTDLSGWTVESGIWTRSLPRVVNVYEQPGALSQSFLVPPSVGSATLAWSDQNAAYPDATPFSAEVLIVDAGDDVLSTTPLSLPANTDTDWTPHSVDVSAALAGHAGETLTLRFSNLSASFASDWSIDDISLTVGFACRGQAVTMLGTLDADVLLGTPESDVILALGGDDTIRGGGGDDVICAGGGIDTIRAGSGHDLVAAGPGDDVVLGGRGDDLLLGGGGNDTLKGGADTDVCKGGPGTGDTATASCETVRGVP